MCGKWSIQEPMWGSVTYWDTTLDTYIVYLPTYPRTT
jgi:hypothetical protein